jgi:hypothetical protein
MAKKQTVLSDELKAAIEEAARAGAYEAYKVNVGSYVNYFKAMESLLYNYKKLEALVADEEAYCEVEYHAGKKTFAAMPTSKGYFQQKTEADIIEELQEERRKQFQKTKYGFESLKKAIRLFENQKEFAVIRLYYFGEDINGNPRAGGKAATWEEVANELEEAGLLKEIKTARRWRNKIVNDMAVCVFGVPAALSAGTYRERAIDK